MPSDEPIISTQPPLRIELQPQQAAPLKRLLTAIANSIRGVRWKKAKSWFYGAAGGVVTFFSLVALSIDVWPSVTIDASEPLNPTDPYSSQFFIKNEYLVPIRNADASCVAAIYENGDIRIQDHPSAMTGMREPIPSLLRSERYSIRCFQSYTQSGDAGEYFPVELPFSNILKRAEIQIRVIYSLPMLPWIRLENRRRFVALPDALGKFSWSQEPLALYRGYPKLKKGVPHYNQLTVYYLRACPQGPLTAQRPSELAAGKL